MCVCIKQRGQKQQQQKSKIKTSKIANREISRSMTGELTSRNGVEQRPLRLPQHPIKTDEIEILESAGGGEEQHQDKVFCYICTFLFYFQH